MRRFLEENRKFTGKSLRHYKTAVTTGTRDDRLYRQKPAAYGPTDIMGSSAKLLDEILRLPNKRVGLRLGQRLRCGRLAFGPDLDPIIRTTQRRHLRC